MSAQIRTLKADITADLKTIAEIYAALDTYSGVATSDEQLIVRAYYQ